MKRKVAIFTDSTVDISKELLKEKNIQMIPLYVHFGEEVYRDSIDITVKQLYEMVEKKGILPSTQATSPGEFLEYVKPYLDQDYDIVYCGIGSKLSATLKSANLIASEYPNRIFTIDSMNLSSAAAILLFKACDLRNQGKSAKEIQALIQPQAKYVISNFTIKNFEYLYKGGRASGLQAVFGTALRVRPVLRTIDGQLVLYKKPVGKFKKGMDVQIKDFLEQYKKGNIDTKYVFITHSLNHKGFLYIKEQLKLNQVEIENLYEGFAGSVISSHCGEGTIGILYQVKELIKD